jgi:putrescine aminotransferase
LKTKYQLLGIEEALGLNRNQVRDYYKSFINPGLAGMLGLLNFDKQFVKAKGIEVWDSDGNVYLDFLGGYGAVNLGHNPPDVIEAIEKVRDLPNILQAALGTLASALAYNLALILPGDLNRCFFCNSGAEAVEGALKLARAASKKSKIVYCHGSFHGKTMGALSVTGREKYQKYFHPLVPDCYGIPYGDLESLEKIIFKKDVAAFIVEPIQGEGGIIVPPEGYLKGARALCDRYEVLLIGAYVAKERVWDQAYGGMDKALLHTSTFGGNSWAAAAAIAAINLLVEKDLSSQASEMGDYLLRRLLELKQKYPLIKDVRGKGLMIGIEFEKPAGLANKLTGGMANKLSEEYLGALVAGELQNKYRIITAYTLNNPNVIRLEPPLIVTKDQIDAVIHALTQIFEAHRSFWGLALAGGRTIIGSLLKK